jgi:DNA-binding beta-propeller fold protein YncE
MKRMSFCFFWAAVVVSAQTLDRLTPEERTKLESQNTALRSLLQNAPKLPLEQTEIKGWPTGLISWVASDRHGLIYLLQRNAKVDPVIVVDRDGTIVRSWGKGMYSTPHAIRIDPQGHIWTTDAASSMVYEFTPEGKKLLEISVGGLPTPRVAFCGTTDIAFAPNGHLFIADGYRNARILEYTPDGKKIREWGSPGTGPGQFHLPHSIQIDENGVIYVADRENGRIQRFDLQGNYLGEWSQYGKTFGLKLDKDAIWLSSIPRGPNGPPGWLIKLDHNSGALLGYLETTGTHGIEVTTDGEVLSASPAAGKAALWYRLRN